MWKLNDLGVVSWVTDKASCALNLSGGGSCLALHPFPGREQAAVLTEGFAPISLASVDDHALPVASEQYVRQNRLTINYPQDQAAYAIRLSLELMRSSETQLVFEVTVSIQTDLLDSHPMLDVVIPGINATSYSVDDTAENWRQTLQGALAGSDSMHCIESEQMRVGVLLDRHDAPTTKTLTDADGIRLRLFGDFLEKGVIRTARPWIVVDRSSETLSIDSLTAFYRALEERPLPLAT